MNACNQNCYQGRRCTCANTMERTAPVPRTMQQAFGPYTSDELHAKDGPVNAIGHKVAGVLSLMLLAALAFAEIAGWLK